MLTRVPEKCAVCPQRVDKRVILSDVCSEFDVEVSFSFELVTSE